MQTWFLFSGVVLLLILLVWRSLRQRRFLFAGESAPAPFVLFGLLMDLLLPTIALVGFIVRLGAGRETIQAAQEA